MKTKIIFLLIFICIFYGCIGTPDWNSMEPYLEPEVTETGILKLEFDPSKSNVQERILYDSITKKLFLDNNSKSYGYYNLELDYKEKHKMTIAQIILPLALYGVPTDNATFNLTVKFCVFNSNGEIIKEYTDKSTVKQKSRLLLFYPHGTDPSEKIGNAFTSMIENIFSLVKSDTNQINQALLKSGPITTEKSAQAKIAIADYHEKNKEKPTLTTNTVMTKSYDGSMNYSTEPYYDDEKQDGADIALGILNTLNDSLKQVEEGLNDALNNKYIHCYSCNGTGKCTSCNGVGERYGKCFMCKGTGSCYSCGGDGNKY